jgi:hypothetical protein
MVTSNWVSEGGGSEDPAAAHRWRYGGQEVAILESLAAASRGSVDRQERARRVRLPSGVQQALAPAPELDRPTLAQLNTQHKPRSMRYTHGPTITASRVVGPK